MIDPRLFSPVLDTIAILLVMAIIVVLCRPKIDSHTQEILEYEREILETPRKKG